MRARESLISRPCRATLGATGDVVLDDQEGPEMGVMDRIAELEAASMERTVERRRRQAEREKPDYVSGYHRHRDKICYVDHAAERDRAAQVRARQALRGR